MFMIYLPEKFRKCLPFSGTFYDSLFIGSKWEDPPSSSSWMIPTWEAFEEASK